MTQYFIGIHKCTSSHYHLRYFSLPLWYYPTLECFHVKEDKNGKKSRYLFLALITKIARRVWLIQNWYVVLLLQCPVLFNILYE